MKINWGLIKFVVLTALIIALFGFTKQRNDARKLTKINIEFLDQNAPFITRTAVNKMLIQNQDSVTSLSKETLVLKDMESRLLKNEMIRTANVFVTVEGELGAKIEQRNPIARIAASPDFYIDEDGLKMPLSSVYTARVLLVTGNTVRIQSELTYLILKIREDNFMNKSVVGIDVANDGMMLIRIRKHTFKVLFGDTEAIDLKFQNYKAFYQKAKKDNSLEEYKTVDLRFGSQVVATKK
jgi:cell division protein FtsQ